MRILIAGCGYVGTALAERLTADAHEVWALRRRVEATPPGVTPVAADLTDPASLAGLPPGLDAVVYAASAGGRGESVYRAIYVDGVRNLIAALDRAGARPERFLFTSSTGVYAQCNGGWVDEDSPAEPPGETGRCLLEGEAVTLAAPWPSAVVRFGGIYGPGRTRLVARARSGEVRFRPGVWTNRIHRDDCAGVLAHLLAVEALPDLPERLIGVDSEPANEETVLAWLCAELGTAPPTPDPEPAPVRSNKRCRNERLLATGYRFRFPTFREGYGPLLGMG